MNTLRTPRDITEAYIQGVITQAITDVAKHEYNRLASDLPPFDIMQRLTDALVELRGLGSGNMPSYNSWTALCHLTWYQPHHINLAFTILRELSASIRNALAGTQELNSFRWIDFGCGSLPMHIALSAALTVESDLRSARSRVSGIGIDSSDHMLRLGEALVRNIQKHDCRLTQGCKNLQTSSSIQTISSSLRGSATTPTILSVMHAFYRENISEIEAALASLISASDPELVFVTAHPSSEALVDCAFSRHNHRYDFVSKRFDYTQPLWFSGQLIPITAFRQGLAQLIEIQRADVVNEGMSARQDFADFYQTNVSEWDVASRSFRNELDSTDLQFVKETDMAINYLRKEVCWSGAEVEARVYFRKQT